MQPNKDKRGSCHIALLCSTIRVEIVHLPSCLMRFSGSTYLTCTWVHRWVSISPPRQQVFTPLLANTSRPSEAFRHLPMPATYPSKVTTQGTQTQPMPYYYDSVISFQPTSKTHSHHHHHIPTHPNLQNCNICNITKLVFTVRCCAFNTYHVYVVTIFL